MGNIVVLEVIGTATAVLCADRARLRSSRSRMLTAFCSTQYFLHTLVSKSATTPVQQIDIIRYYNSPLDQRNAVSVISHAYDHRISS